MPIKQVLSTAVLTMLADGKREYVTLETFLNLFEADYDTRLAFTSFHNNFIGDNVEKRVEVSLIEGLEKQCLWGPRFSDYAPIVTVDGWVFWVKSHQQKLMLEALSSLYSSGEVDDPNFVVERGLVWHIDYLDRRKIICGQLYNPSDEDLKIFERFEVERIIHF